VYIQIVFEENKGFLVFEDSFHNIRFELGHQEGVLKVLKHIWSRSKQSIGLTFDLFLKTTTDSNIKQRTPGWRLLKAILDLEYMNEGKVRKVLKRKQHIIVEQYTKMYTEIENKEKNLQKIYI
jgi:hypothetical protein